MGAHVAERIREVLSIRTVRHRLRRAASNTVLLLEIGDRAIEASNEFAKVHGAHPSPVPE